MGKISKLKKQKPELAKKDTIKINPWKPGSSKEGQVTLHLKSVSTDEGILSVNFDIRNGYTRKVKLKKLPLLLLDTDQRVLARQTFDGEPIGEIGGRSSKACIAQISSDNVYVKEIPEKCQLFFDIPPKEHQSTKIQYQALPEHTSETQKQELERILANLPPMKPGEVSVSPLNAKVTTNNDLLATIIVRNFAKKKINLAQLPLVIFDAHREELARGQFDIKGTTIEAFKAILLTLNFGPVAEEREIDLSSWSVNIMTKQQSSKTD